MPELDLFTPVVSEAEQHPNFRTILKYGNQYNCDVLNNWASGFKDRDGKFVKEFQTTFDSSFWELYLFAVLKHFGMAVDFSVPSPDFLVTTGAGMNIEATVALQAQGSPPEHAARKASDIPKDLNEFNRQTILRIRNSIDTKNKKYSKTYASLKHVADRPFVLAITAFDSPFARLACQRAIEAVLYGYYVDEEKFLREGGTLEKGRLTTVRKDNLSEVPLAIFGMEEFEWLSAVVFSSCASWGKVRALSADPNPAIFFEAARLNSSGVIPHVERTRKAQYSESLMDGLRVYHNPSATHPLDLKTFRHPDIFQSHFSEENGEWMHDQRDGLLLYRSVFTAIPRTQANPGADSPE
ncbi:MAG: hypothetical protein WCC21_03040 [Candidatus Acidiferrales bacterium]